MLVFLESCGKMIAFTEILYLKSSHDIVYAKKKS